MLRQARDFFPYTYVIAGVSGDEETIRLKGKLVMSEEERAKSVLSCRYVDEVIMPCPWILSLDFLKEHDIDFVAHDAVPYGSAGEDDIYHEIKKAGRFLETQRTPGISTSDLIMRIIKDYDEYVWRSLQRGAKPSDMNVSKLKAAGIKMGQKLKEIKMKVSGGESTFERLKNKVKGAYGKWKHNSKRLIGSFIHQFDSRVPDKTSELQSVPSDAESPEHIFSDSDE